MPSRRAAYLVFNPAAGRGGLDELDTILRGLRDHFEVTVGETSREVDADAHARRAVEGGADVVIAVGGDGTASLVASAVVNSRAVMGIIPRGTMSAFAAATGIPSDLDAAIAAITQGEVGMVDTAVANGRVMLLIAAIGFHADAVADASRESKNRFGVFGYLASGLKHLLELAPFTVEAETESALIRCVATSVTVANAAPPTTILAQGPAKVSPIDGLLDATFVASEGLAEAVATGLHLFKSALDEEPATRDKVGFLPVKRIRLSADREVRALVDGEPAGTTPLSIECRPRSLKLFMPQAIDVGPPISADLSRLPGLEVEVKGADSGPITPALRRSRTDAP